MQKWLAWVQEELMRALRWTDGWLAEELGAVVEELVQGPEDVSAGPEDDLEGLARPSTEAERADFSDF